MPVDEARPYPDRHANPTPSPEARPEWPHGAPVRRHRLAPWSRAPSSPPCSPSSSEVCCWPSSTGRCSGCRPGSSTSRWPASLPASSSAPLVEWTGAGHGGRRGRAPRPGAFYAIWFLTRRFLGLVILGFGDVRLAIVLGMVLGWYGLEYVYYGALVGHLLAVAIAVATCIHKRKLHVRYVRSSAHRWRSGGRPVPRLAALDLSRHACSIGRRAARAQPRGPSRAGLHPRRMLLSVIDWRYHRLPTLVEDALAGRPPRRTRARMRSASSSS